MDRLFYAIWCAGLLASLSACIAPRATGAAQAKAGPDTGTVKAALADDLHELECDDDPPTGSHIRVEVCRSTEVADAQRAGSQDTLRRTAMDRSNLRNPNSGVPGAKSGP